MMAQINKKKVLENKPRRNVKEIDTWNDKYK